jgi:Leucine-rich repeat (LRR) protein
VTLLSLYDKQLKQLPETVKNNTQLTILAIAYNQLTSVKGLEKHTQLRSLNLFHNQLASVKGLEKLAQLETLILTDNPDLTKAQIDELQKALPNCKIYSNPTK